MVNITHGHSSLHNSKQKCAVVSHKIKLDSFYKPMAKAALFKRARSFRKSNETSNVVLRCSFICIRYNKKYSKMDKRAKDKLVRSPRENGGG